MNRSEVMDTALRRIFAAAQALERGEEAPREVAQEIQCMAIAGLDGADTMEWPWLEAGALVGRYLAEDYR